MTQTDHKTYEFTRVFKAPLERVFGAFESVEAREAWAVPGADNIVIFEQDDFRPGGIDVYRCGPRANPEYTVRDLYHAIEPDSLILFSETLEAGGQVLSAALNTVRFSADGEATVMHLTVQATSLVGQDMIEGYEEGWLGALEKLEAWISTPAVA